MNKTSAFLFLPPERWDRIASPEARSRLAQEVEFDSSESSPSINVSTLLEQAEKVQILITSWKSPPLDASVLERLERLELLIHAAGSVREVLPQLQADAHFRVCTGVHLNARPVAEFTLGVILCALRDTFAWRDKFRRQGTDLWWSHHEQYQGGYEGKTICLVGFGAIVRHLARLLRQFNFRTLVVSDQVTPRDEAEFGFHRVTLAEGAATANVLSIHEASLPSFRHLINREVLDLMKPNSWLINTARGSLIDESALIEALRAEKIWALLDVAQVEPPPLDHPFYHLPRCILTPHIAGSLGNEILRFGDYVAREVHNHCHRKPYESELQLETLALRA